MPSLSPVSSAAEPPTVVVAALSARALAQAARRAGYQVVALDLFGDRDTRDAAAESHALPGSLDDGLEPAPLLACLEAQRSSLAGRPLGLVYGSGFEDRPDFLEEIAERLPLIGNTAETVRRVKDPRIFFSVLAACGIAFPEVALEPPGPEGNWLTKRIGGSGGSHISSRRGDAPAAGHYFQRRVDGRPVSALFLADGCGTQIVGLSEQWSSSDASAGAFRYGGAAQPAAVTGRQSAAITAAITTLVPAFDLRGLNSADFMVRAGDLDLLELNPRPGATLDLFDSGLLFARHCDACAGTLSREQASAAGAQPARAAAVVYAPNALVVPAGVAWPTWAADLPCDGSVIDRDAPLCTVLAEAGSVEAARRLVGSRRAEVLALLGIDSRAERAEAFA